MHDPHARIVAAALGATLLGWAGPSHEAPLPIAPPRPALMVCADPSNLPYSNDRQEGFENKIATLLAADLHEDLHYVWNEQRRSFFRHTLFAGRCDVVISVPASLPILAVTRPYFRSGYVAVTRNRDGLRFSSFDQPEWRNARIGLQLLGAEGSNTPPAMALASRGVTQHITGFPMWADESVPTPQGKIVDAVALKTIDVAMVWGPFAGYFAKPYGASLRLDLIAGDPKRPALAFSYDMALGVRKTDLALRDRMQGALDRHQTEIQAILRDYGIPLLPLSAVPQQAALHLPKP